MLRHPTRRLLSLLALVAAAPAVLLLAGCGGGGASADTGNTVVDTSPTAPPGTDPTPAPTPDSPLDAQLAALAADAGAAAQPDAPAQDAALVALGQALFFDRVLSGNQDISCYTCHDVDFATGDGLSVSIGTGGLGKGAARQLARGLLIPRNAPHLFRLGGARTLFWDGRVSRQNGVLTTPEPALNGPTPAASGIAAQLTTALAAQAMFPVTSHDEMAGQPGENEIADAGSNLEVWALLMRRLVGTDDGSAPGLSGYRTLFAAAYPGVARWDDFNFGHAARAIAAFEVHAFHTQGAAFDRWLAGNRAALSTPQKEGGVLFFGRAGCARCHGGAAFTDGRFHAIGVPQVGPGKDGPGEDTGRGLVTGDPQDRYRFRTPSLRNVALTGPWMHDGAYTTLENAIAHYRDPVQSLRVYDRTQLDPLLRALVDTDPVRQDARAQAISNLVRGGVRLSPQDVDRLAAFLGALSDPEALDLAAFEPDTVPSGLPIDDE